MVKRGPFVTEPGLWSEVGKVNTGPAFYCLNSKKLSSSGNMTCFMTVYRSVMCWFDPAQLCSQPALRSVQKVGWDRLTPDAGILGLSQGLWAKDWLLPRWEEPLDYCPLHYYLCPLRWGGL